MTIRGTESFKGTRHRAKAENKRENEYKGTIFSKAVLSEHL